MGASIGALTVSLGLDAAQYTEGLTQADRQAQNFAAQQTRTQASIDKTVASLARQASQIGLTTSQIKLQALAAKGASEAQLAQASGYLKALDDAAAAQKKNSHETEEAGSILDLFAGKTARARTEMIVLGHELTQGNYKRAVGSFQVLAESAGATGSIFSLTTAIFATTALAIGAVVVAAVKGAEESAILARNIAATGNAAGLTEGRFNELAASQAKLTNSTIGTAREILGSLAQSGRFSGIALKAAGDAATFFAKATGTSSEEASKQFISLADNVVSGSEDMNRQFHFLNATQLGYIQTLHRQGDDQKALLVSFDALTARLKDTQTNLGAVETGWQGVKNAASAAWDAMLGIGRAETLQDKLAKVGGQIRTAQMGLAATGGNVGGEQDLYAQQYSEAPDISGLQEAQGIYQDDLKWLNQIADAQAAKVRQDQADIVWMHLQEDSLTKQEKLARDLGDALAKASNKYHLDVNDPALAAKPDVAQVLADIREKAFPAQSTSKSTLDSDLQALRNSLAEETDAFKSADQVMAALRSAGLVDDQSYYAQKLVSLHAYANAEASELEAEIARREKATFTGTEAKNQEIENAKAIAEAQTKLAKIYRETATQEDVIDIERAAAIRKRAAAYVADYQAALDALAGVKRAHDQELSQVGLGGDALATAKAHGQIADKYQADVDRANAEIAAKRLAGTATTDDEAAYSAKLHELEQFKDAAITEWDDYYSRLKAAQDDWTNGYTKGLADYVANVGSMSDRVGKLTTDTFQGMEDALVNFATTGKLDVHSLADSIVADMVRIAVQESLLKPISTYLQAQGAGGGLIGWLTGLGGNSATATPGGADNFSAVENFGSQLSGLGAGHAIGGTAMPGGLYPVNENGPEVLDVGGRQFLMTGNTRARVIPAGSGSDGGSRPIQVVQHFAAGTSKATADQAAAAAGAAVRKALARTR